MTTDESKATSASQEIKKRVKTLKVKIYDWKKKGYNVSRFTTLIDQDISLAEKEFDNFVRTIQQMERLEERLYTLDTTGYEDRVSRIEDLLKDPGKIDEFEKEVILLEEDILREKFKQETGEKEHPEVDLKNELARIRQEELERIRKDESGRLKEQERKRILNEELDRIREEEREKLRKSELDRIRKEEKERIVWEDRVLKQLRQAKEREAEKSRKKMKCRSCKGTIVITSMKRPLKVRCPTCGKDYTLKAKSDGESGQEGDSKIKYKKCPKCSSPIPIISDKRPLKIICQMCNSEYLLKERSGGEGGKHKPTTPGELANQALPPLGPKSQGLETRDYGSQEIKDGGNAITCPTCSKEIPGEANICGYCGSPIDHNEVRKNQAVSCSNCGKEIPGDARICGYCGTPVQTGTQSTSTDELELPLAPNERILDDLGNDKSQFKPLNEYLLPTTPDATPKGIPPNPPASSENPMDGITCPKCGNLVPRGAKFCGTCGNTM